ncbi:MAG: hypothetical protein HZB86_04215 [Deltaproteobacteria bacterium]|nr:hypothetical protein [Deltaproteobacteria bacterium]
MIRASCIALAAFAICGIAATIASATPSTQIWIPSTDVQAFKTGHFGFDTYVRTKPEPGTGGQNVPPVVDLGLTAGVLPFQKIQAEVGFDLIYGGFNTSSGLDKYPIYLNAKVGIPEDAFFKMQPAVAVGGYNWGTKKGEVTNGVYTKTGTDANIWYGLVAKTLPVVGRFSVGYYGLNKKSSVATVYDSNGVKGDESGLLASWDRTMSEISDKLWVAVDHQGGKNAFGATSFAFSWAFAKNVSVIFGYDVYNNKARAGQNTATVQLDINFP